MYCNSCKGETRHEVLATHTRRYDYIENEDTPYPQLVFWEEWEYWFLACRGCDTSIQQVVYTHEGMFDPDQGNQILDISYYPRREKEVLQRKRFRHLDPKLESIYEEAIATFNADARFACGMCLRALLEGICVNKGITDDVAWGLEGKLKKLEEGNHLPPNIVEYLLSFKFIGDDAAHRLEAASRTELESAIGVMDDLLNFLYEVEYELLSKAQKLAKLRSSDRENFRKRNNKSDEIDKGETT